MAFDAQLARNVIALYLASRETPLPLPAFPQAVARRAEAEAIRAAEPGITEGELAARLGVTPRTLRRDGIRHRRPVPDEVLTFAVRLVWHEAGPDARFIDITGMVNELAVLGLAVDVKRAELLRLMRRGPDPVVTPARADGLVSGRRLAAAFGMHHTVIRRQVDAGRLTPVRREPGQGGNEVLLFDPARVKRGPTRAPVDVGWEPPRLPERQPAGVADAAGVPGR